jgi:hypothetical protein
MLCHFQHCPYVMRITFIKSICSIENIMKLLLSKCYV